MRSLGIVLTVLVIFWSIGANDATAARVQILDRCDPATFGPALCNPNFDGGVTLAEFQEQLQAPLAFGHPAWRFNAPYVVIDSDDRVRVVNKGGEGHTFTEVPEVEEGKTPFGGGRVDALNKPLGLQGHELPICLNANQSPVIPAGGSVRLKNLSEGTHYFQCCIHPWMHAIIEVESEKDSHHHDHD